MSLIEGIQVLRDLVIILSAIIVTSVVVMVGRVFLRLTRKAEEMQAFVTNTANVVLNPVRGLLLAFGRGRRKRA